MSNHRPTLRILLIAFPLLAHALCATAASFMPIVHNYHKSDYMGALQNWDIAQGVNGEIYVGNTDGLLCFDGYNWTLTPLPGDGIVRSVMADGRRVYVGSYKEFGYFERNARGQMVFTSLWPATTTRFGTLSRTSTATSTFSRSAHGSTTTASG